MDLSIVIVSYRVRERLRECLQSLRVLDSARFQVIVVDNDSRDGTMEELPRDFPEVRFFAMDRNTGFAMACNRGAQAADAPWILFLNPDTVVFPETLDRVLAFAAEHEKAGMLGCRILDGEGNLQLACRRSIPTPTVALWRLLGLSFLFPRSRIFARYNLTYLDPAVDCQVEAVSGSFMMIRTGLFRDLGGFDESFFLYGEDLDLCLRTAKAGWEIWYCGQATVIHHKGQSAAARPLGARWNFYHAMVVFAVKNFGVGRLGRVLLEGAALTLTSGELLARRYGKVKNWALDLLLANGIFFVISALYLWLRLGVFYLSMGARAWVWHLALSLWVLLGCGLAGLYNRRAHYDMRTLHFGLGVSAAGFLITGFLFKNLVYSRAAFLLAAVGMTAALSGRYWYRLMHLQKRARRLLVLGTGEQSRQTAGRLRAWPRNFQVLGYVDVTGKGGQSIAGDLPVTGLNALEPMVRALDIDGLVLPAGDAAELLTHLSGYALRLPVMIEVPSENGPPLLGDVTLKDSTIVESP